MNGEFPTNITYPISCVWNENFVFDEAYENAFWFTFDISFQKEKQNESLLSKRVAFYFFLLDYFVMWHIQPNFLATLLSQSKIISMQTHKQFMINSHIFDLHEQPIQAKWISRHKAQQTKLKRMKNPFLSKNFISLHLKLKNIRQRNKNHQFNVRFLLFQHHFILITVRPCMRYYVFRINHNRNSIHWR